MQMPARMMLMTIAAALTLVGCGLSAPATSRSTAAHPAAEVSPGLQIPLTSENGSHAAGTAVVAPSQNSFTVHLLVHGLQPSSTHPAHIHAGHCRSNGPIVYPLKNLVAGNAGIATSTSTVPHPYQVPKGGWFINVHQGPNLAGKGATPIACAQIPTG